jgi:hypothetical protein
VTDPTPFADLPAALVEEVLGQACAAGDLLLEEFKRIRSERPKFREMLETARLLRHESELGYPPLPTTAATDGSYAIERLLTTDLAAAAAVAVEGLTPPSETRYWDQPRHSTFVAAEMHNVDTATVLRAVMLGRELLLAVQAPHDLVMLDMTLTLPVIYPVSVSSNVPRNFFLTPQNTCLRTETSFGRGAVTSNSYLCPSTRRVGKSDNLPGGRCSTTTVDF